MSEEKARSKFITPDIFLYPFSISGLVHLGIFIAMPILSLILGRFSILFWVVKICVGSYLYWYIAYCIHTSGTGQNRAPQTYAYDHDFRDTIIQWCEFFIVYIIFFGPALFYYAAIQKADTIFWSLLLVGTYIYPMALLAVVMFNSLSALNPLIIIPSIFSTFIPYTFLAVMFSGWILLVLKFLNDNGENQSYLLGFAFYCFLAYSVLVGANILGRFYNRFSEKLDWYV